MFRQGHEPRARRDYVSVTFDDLYNAAKSVINPRKLSGSADAGGGGAALLSDSGAAKRRGCLQHQ
jgi:cytidine deaminase